MRCLFLISWYIPTSPVTNLLTLRDAYTFVSTSRHHNSLRWQAVRHASCSKSCYLSKRDNSLSKQESQNCIILVIPRKRETFYFFFLLFFFFLSLCFILFHFFFLRRIDWLHYLISRVDWIPSCHASSSSSSKPLTSVPVTSIPNSKLDDKYVCLV